MNAQSPERQSRAAYLPNPGAPLKRLSRTMAAKRPARSRACAAAILTAAVSLQRLNWLTSLPPVCHECAALFAALRGGTFSSSTGFCRRRH